MTRSKTVEDDKQEETKLKGHRLPTNSFKTKLIGCATIKGQMNDSIWQNHVKSQFKTLIDIRDMVRKDVCVEYDRKHVRLMSDDKSSKNLLIFRHRIKSIVHEHHSVKFKYGCYLYKVSNSTFQLVAIESNQSSGKLVNLIRRLKRNLSNGLNSTRISLGSPDSQRSSSSIRRSGDTSVDSNHEEAAVENETCASIEVIDISSSESEDETSSEIDIVDILPPVPFRNHTFTNIEDD